MACWGHRIMISNMSWMISVFVLLKELLKDLFQEF